MTGKLTGWHLSRSGKSRTAESALEQPLIAHFGTLARVPAPFLLRSDNGLVFPSRNFAALVRSYGLRQEFITPHSPEQNGLVDRVIRTLEEHYVHRHRFESMQHSSRHFSHIAQDADLTPGVGTDVLGLSDALRNNGLSAARAATEITIDDLVTATAKGNAAIVHVNLTGDVCHFVVVDGIKTRGGQLVVAVLEPLDGQLFIKVEIFKNKFSGQAVLTNEHH